MTYLKKVLVAFLLAFSLCICSAYSQNTEINTNTVQTENSADNTSSQEEFFQNWDTPSEENRRSSGSSFWLFVRMIVVLAIVVALIYGVMWFIKKQAKLDDSKDEFLRQVAKVSVGPGKSVQVVTLIDKAYLIGVSDNSVNLISEVEDKELINAMNLYADKQKNTKKPRTFADVLEIFMPNGPKEKSVFDEQNKSFNEMSNKQRERIYDEE